MSDKVPIIAVLAVLAVVLLFAPGHALTVERTHGCSHGKGFTIERFVDEDDDGVAERIEYADARTGFVLATIHFKGTQFDHATALGVRYATAGELERETVSPCAVLERWLDAGGKKGAAP